LQVLCLRKFLHIDAMSSHKRDHTQRLNCGQSDTHWKHVAALVKFNVFKACWDYGESRERAVRMGRKLVCEALCRRPGYVSRVELSSFEFLTPLYICLLIVTREARHDAGTVYDDIFCRGSYDFSRELMFLCRSPKVT
jgi:hypothetical protein